MTCKQFDYAIVGAGVAGLSLLMHLARSPMRDRSMLIVDSDLASSTDATYGFWIDHPTAFDEITERSWRRLRIATHASDYELELARYRYSVIRRREFRDFVRRELRKLPGVAFVEGRVERVVATSGSATVVLEDGTSHAARWVFDSRPRARPNCLWQSFEAWEIESPHAGFDASAVTLMDFRAPQTEASSFMYMLPFDGCRALVAHVVWNARQTDDSSALAAYSANTLGLPEYRVLRCERGASPLDAGRYPRRLGSHIMAIGVAGGRLKPSTGYAFTRIQRDSAAIVRSLQKVGHPFDVPPDSPRHRCYDAVLVELLRREPWRAELLFDHLFARNSGDRILAFLDEATSFFDELRLALTLPPWFWVRALMPRLDERGEACQLPLLSW